MDKELLVSKIHKYFALKRFHSFIRQLSGWGFKRLHQPGPDHGCYYHECFLRGIPRLTWLMRRVQTKRGKPVPNIEGEPDFYGIAMMYPLIPAFTYGHDQYISQAARPAVSATALCLHPSSTSHMYSSYGQSGNNQSNTEKTTAPESATLSSTPGPTESAAAAFGVYPTSISHIYSNLGQSRDNPLTTGHREFSSAANKMTLSMSYLDVAPHESMSQPGNYGSTSFEGEAVATISKQLASNRAIRESCSETYFQSFSTTTSAAASTTNVQSLPAPSFNNYQQNPYYHVDNNLFPSHFPLGDPFSCNPYFYQYSSEDEQAGWSSSSTASYPLFSVCGGYEEQHEQLQEHPPQLLSTVQSRATYQAQDDLPMGKKSNG